MVKEEEEERHVLAVRGRSVPPPARVCDNGISFSIFRQKSVISNILLRYAFQFDTVQFPIMFIL
jgi:hypothetical protein